MAVQSKSITESKVTFVKGSSFYNPYMELNRTMSSLAVGAVHEKLKVCDGMSASGIRGMRYMAENNNVQLVNFVEANKKVCPVIKKNIKLNKLKDCTVFCENFMTHMSTHHEYNFIEVDPFGTPVPYLHAALSSFAANHHSKQVYLSVTATDTAVLHGAHHRATPKIYHSKPVRQLFMYEFGTRILLAYVARAAHEFDYKIEPVMSFSHRHYIKLILKLVRGARVARKQEHEMLGYVILNPGTCAFRALSFNEFYKQGLKLKKNEIIGGPVYLDELHERKVLDKMSILAKKRDHLNALKMIELMKNEKGLLYYDLHYMAKVTKLSLPKKTEIIEHLIQKGYYAAPTHFTPTGIRTNAEPKIIRKFFK